MNFTPHDSVKIARDLVDGGRVQLALFLLAFVFRTRSGAIAQAAVVDQERHRRGLDLRRRAGRPVLEHGRQDHAAIEYPADLHAVNLRAHGGANERILGLRFPARDVRLQFREQLRRQGGISVELLPLPFRQQNMAVAQIGDGRAKDGARPVAGDEQHFENHRRRILDCVDAVQLVGGGQDPHELLGRESDRLALLFVHGQ